MTFCVRTSLAIVLTLISVTAAVRAAESDLWVHYEGKEGPGKGKRIVLIAGDEEYRSEEALPMLGRLLAAHHGFDCTVLFSLNPDTGEIDPENQTNIPGIAALDDADMMIIATRFRELPDADMEHVDAFVNSGKPILGLRTATHAFNYSRNKDSKFAKYSFNSRAWLGGFGQQVLGDTWISHHGHHKVESTRGVINESLKDHPILRGVKDVWGPTDVYGIRNLPSDSQVLLYGQVLTGMKPEDPPVAGEKNEPMMPIFWVREFTGAKDKTSKVICTTMGASVDLLCDDLRRALVNSCYWALDLDVPALANVEIVGEYNPTFYGFGSYQKGKKPADWK
ncbi:MAG: ThuA domain-containing protein [Planctomycetales bacterium]|nr:ThuA domain-containing protein [Planctomycetales bacterium]